MDTEGFVTVCNNPTNGTMAAGKTAFAFAFPGD